MKAKLLRLLIGFVCVWTLAFLIFFLFSWVADEHRPSVADTAGVAVILAAAAVVAQIFREAKRAELQSKIDESDCSIDVEDLNRRIKTVLIAWFKERSNLPSLAFPHYQGLSTKEFFERYCLLDNIEVRVSYAPTLEKPGTIRSLGHTRYEITVDSRYRTNPSIHSAILAHEFAHIWVDENLAPMLRAEERTVDVAATLTGHGLLMLAAVQRDVSEIEAGFHTHTQRFGYLTLSEFGYVLAVFVQLIGEKPKRFFEYLPPVSRAALIRGYEPLRRKPTWELATKTQFILQCHICSQSLRFPRHNGKILRVKCAVCKTQFDVRASRFWHSVRVVRAGGSVVNPT
jgi:hypothetical protein